MNKNGNCEITWVCSLERVLAKIGHKLVGPLGVVVFGVDQELNTCVVDKLKKVLDPYVSLVYSKHVTTAQAWDILTAHKENLILCLEPEDSANAKLRRTIAQNMSISGAQTVVAVYVQVEAKPRRMVQSEAIMSRNRKVEVMEDSDPRALRYYVDYFVMVPEEDL